jgi:hypothetical protein
MRSILPRQPRRTWRRNRTQNPPYPSRHSVLENGTTSVYMNEAILQQMIERNRRRQKMQRIGLSFLLLSFLLGASSISVD